MSEDDGGAELEAGATIAVRAVDARPAAAHGVAAETERGARSQGCGGADGCRRAGGAEGCGECGRVRRVRRCDWRAASGCSLTCCWRYCRVVQAPDAPVLVSAAISLTDAMQEIEKAYVASGGGAGALQFRRLERARAPDRQRRPGRHLHQRRRSADATTRRAAARSTPPRRIDLLAQPSRGRDPDRGTAPRVPRRRRPAGASTHRRRRIPRPSRPAFMRASSSSASGLWHGLQPKLLPLANVRAALAAVEIGGADAAIVYDSDAAASTNVDLAFVVTGNDGTDDHLSRRRS